MIDRKTNNKLILASILIMLCMIIVPLSFYIYTNIFGTEGKEKAGLRYEIQLTQVSTTPKNTKKIIRSIEKTEKKIVPKKTADFSERLKENKKKKKKKKKQKKKKKKKTIVKKQTSVQKTRQKTKQVYDKGTIGEYNLIYANQLQSSIKRHMVAPDDLNRTRIVYITFKLNIKGEILKIKVKKSSGNSEIDKIALETIHISAPFSKPPKPLHHTDLIYTIPLVYKIDND